MGRGTHRAAHRDRRRRDALRRPGVGKRRPQLLRAAALATPGWRSDRPRRDPACPRTRDDVGVGHRHPATGSDSTTPGRGTGPSRRPNGSCWSRTCPGCPPSPGSSRSSLVVSPPSPSWRSADPDDLDYLPSHPDVTVVSSIGTGNGHAPSRLAQLVTRPDAARRQRVLLVRRGGGRIPRRPKALPRPRVDGRPVRHHRLLAVRLRDLGREVRPRRRRRRRGLRTGAGRRQGRQGRRTRSSTKRSSGPASRHRDRLRPVTRRRRRRAPRHPTAAPPRHRLLLAAAVLARCASRVWRSAPRRRPGDRLARRRRLPRHRRPVDRARPADPPHRAGSARRARPRPVGHPDPGGGTQPAGGRRDPRHQLRCSPVRRQRRSRSSARQGSGPTSGSPSPARSSRCCWSTWSE